MTLNVKSEENSLGAFLNWAMLGIFYFIFIISKQLIANKNLLMTGFEPWIYGVESDGSTN